MVRIGDILKRKRWLVVLLLLVGIVARFAAAARGHNFDFDSWRLVAGITHHGGNVYAETYRYNYGPVWFEILHGLDWFARLLPGSYDSFRALVVCLLTAVDIGIWYVLTVRFGLAAGFLFFLNPISIIITGYHNQFDNLAILGALAAIIMYGKGTGGLDRWKILGLMLLGVSLATKHIFFLLPFWLAVRQRGWQGKAVTFLLPIGIFLLAFVPFVAGGHEGIINNVLRYTSFNNAPFWYAVVPKFVQSVVSAKLLFFGALAVFAFIMRKRPLLEATLMYTVVLLVFSPSIANQYLAIVCAAIAVLPNLFFVLYALSASLMLAMSSAGLHSGAVKRGLPAPLGNSLSAEATYRAYDVPILFLAVGLLWYFQRANLKRYSRSLIQWGRKELDYQIKSFKA
jgi:hypothetical protein